LWSAAVNGASVVPVTDASANLIPLPQGGDPNAVLTIDVKLAIVSKDPSRIHVAAPIVNAPVMLAEWKLGPDAGQRSAVPGWNLSHRPAVKPIPPVSRNSREPLQSPKRASSLLLSKRSPFWFLLL